MHGSHGLTNGSRLLLSHPSLTYSTVSLTQTQVMASVLLRDSEQTDGPQRDRLLEADNPTSPAGNVDVQARP